LTDERLAEIINTLERANKSGACEDIYADANWLLQALRSESAKVTALECRECSVETAGCKYVDGVVEGIEAELEAERAKVAELVELGKKEFEMYSALKLISNIEIDSKYDKVHRPELYNVVIIARQTLLKGGK
jgi:hypothetical protein